MIYKNQHLGGFYVGTTNNPIFKAIPILGLAGLAEANCSGYIDFAHPACTVFPAAGYAIINNDLCGYLCFDVPHQVAATA